MPKFPTSILTTHSRRKNLSNALLRDHKLHPTLYSPNSQVHKLNQNKHIITNQLQPFQRNVHEKTLRREHSAFESLNIKRFKSICLPETFPLKKLHRVQTTLAKIGGPSSPHFVATLYIQLHTDTCMRDVQRSFTRKHRSPCLSFALFSISTKCYMCTLYMCTCAACVRSCVHVCVSMCVGVCVARRVKQGGFIL